MSKILSSEIDCFIIGLLWEFFVRVLGPNIRLFQKEECNYANCDFWRWERLFAIFIETPYNLKLRNKLVLMG